MLKTIRCIITKTRALEGKYRESQSAVWGHCYRTLSKSVQCQKADAPLFQVVLLRAARISDILLPASSSLVLRRHAGSQES